MRPLALLGLMMLLAGSSRAATTPEVTLGAGQGAPGTSASVPARLANGAGAVALQYDVLFNGGRLSSSSAAPGNALLGHNAFLSTLGNGRSRLLVYSLSNAQLGNGALAELYFKIASNAPLGTVSITLTNGILANSAGKAIAPVTEVPGSLTITAGPARLGEIVRGGDGLIQFQVSGSSGGIYRLEVSTDLVNWTSVATSTAVDGLIQYTDFDSKTRPLRFYRAIAIP